MLIRYELFIPSNFSLNSITYPMARRGIRCEIHRGESRGAGEFGTLGLTEVDLNLIPWLSHGIRILLCITNILHSPKYPQKKNKFKILVTFTGICLLRDQSEELALPSHVDVLVAMMAHCYAMPSPSWLHLSRLIDSFTRWIQVKLISWLLRLTSWLKLTS